MTYRTNGHLLPRIRDYGTALNEYVSLGRKGLDIERPLYNRTTVAGVRKGEEGEIIFRYYDTDCVTYFPDERIQLKAYPTKATDDFINAITPSAISTTFQHVIRKGYTSDGYSEDGGANKNYSYLGVNIKGGRYFHDEGGELRYYFVRDRATIMLAPTADGGFDVESGSYPWTNTTIDIKKRNAVLKTLNWRDFQHWLRTYVALKGEPKAVNYFEYDEVCSLLRRGPDWWPELARDADIYHARRGPEVEVYLANMLHRITEQENCVVRTPLPYLNHWRDIAALKKRERAWA